MKKLLLATLCTLVMTSSCFSIHYNGNGKNVVCKGPVVEKTLDLADFNAITVTGSADMILSQSETFSVKVNANEEVFEYIDFSVENGTLKLKNKDNVQIKAKTFKVYISLPYLENLLVNGAADADIHDYASDKDLTVLVNGAGDFEIVSVKVPTLSLTVNGAGDIDAANLEVNDWNVHKSGLASIKTPTKTN